LNAALNDLCSPDRSAAFAVATAKVWHAFQQHGLQRVFATLERPELW
jgi:hypothetical protein